MTINKKKWSSPRTKLSFRERAEGSANEMRYSYVALLTSIKHAVSILYTLHSTLHDAITYAQVKHLCDEIRQHLQTSHTEFCEQHIYKQCESNKK